MRMRCGWWSLALVGSLASATLAAGPESGGSGAGAMQAVSEDPRAPFVGNWALARVERYDADGTLLPPPEPPAFGAPGATGFIMYDRDGHMGVVIQQGERDGDATAALRTYTSYFGPYTVDADEGHVTHHLAGSLSPNGAGNDNRRYYEFSGNQLLLRPPVGASGVQLQIVWERADARAGLSPDERRFLGFWQIDRVERRTADGEALSARQYEDGYIIYMPSGHMAVHLMRPDRARYAGTTPTAAEAEAALGSYASYFGPFTVHPDEGYVVHHRQGHIRPDQRGTDAQRFYEFDGDRLTLMPPPATDGGQEVQSFIHWRRIGAVE